MPRRTSFTAPTSSTPSPKTPLRSLSLVFTPIDFSVWMVPLRIGRHPKPLESTSGSPPANTETEKQTPLGPTLSGPGAEEKRKATFWPSSFCIIPHPPTHTYIVL
ncbi:hypothetical protein CSUB01_04047 [Colletotrichum sublineola]|uniref:Uncharacterized protein n=1 Tax=Colletotrichum sublineola TaxID=1173701 RepID=A0A066XN07_COLSU|nr:hypothetical protein CSUB01_04047 [Colletotrichum sublineola]